MNIPDIKTIKSIINQIAFAIFTAFFSSFCNSSHAKCILPVADGTEEIVTDRNIAGFFLNIKSDAIFLREYQTNEIVKIELAGLRIAYSAYGGDFNIRELKKGIAMRVWYKNCKKQSNGKSVAAYVEFFSNDLDDKPPEDYFSAKGQ